MNRVKFKVLTGLMFFCLAVPAGVAANWYLNPVDEPFSMNQTGVNTTTVQLVEITYEDPITGNAVPLTPGKVTENWRDNLTYRYNKSMGNSSLLKHFRGKYWYAKFKPNKTRGSSIYYEAAGNTTDGVPSGDVLNITEDINVGNYEINLKEPIPDEYKASRNLNVEVEVIDTETGKILNGSKDHGTVKVIFANETGVAKSYEVDNFENGYFFHSKIETPESTNSSYLMHIKASNSSSSGDHATWSKMIRTLPAIHGKISEFSSPSGCKENNMVKTCEAGAELAVNYTITAAQANYVNLTVYKFNSSSSGRVKVYNATLDKTGNHFTGNFNVSDINTSEYKNKLEYVFNASNNARYHVDRRNVSIKSFRIEDRSPPTTALGRNYELSIFFHKPFSRTPLNKSRFKDIYVEVSYPNGTMMKNFTKQDLNFDQAAEVMTKKFLLGSSLPAGSYSVDINATNIYLENKSIESGFTAEDIDATFRMDSQVEFEPSTLWGKNYSVDIENLVGQTNHLNIYNNLSEEVELLNSSISLQPNQQEELRFRVNISDFNTSVGELTLQDSVSGYNRTLEVTVNPINCEIYNEGLCTDRKWVNVSLDNYSKTVTETVEAFNIGPVGESLQLNISVSGEAADYIQVMGDSSNLTLTGSRQIEFNYSASEAHGNFTGALNFKTSHGTVEVNTRIDANVSTEGNNGGTDNGGGNKDTGSISVSPSSLDLGTFPKGSQRSKTVTLTNNLKKKITKVEVSSNTFAVSTEFSGNISKGGSAKIPLSFESVTSESGSLTISAGGKSKTVTVSADPVPNYKQRAQNQLQPTLEDLQSKVQGNSNLESSLNDVSSTIDQIATAWDRGNYKEAETLYNDADQSLSRIQNQLNSGSDNEDNNESSGGGGIPILPVAGVIFLVILVAFVFFTSYVPEEGDPLYDVLGE